MGDDLERLNRLLDDLAAERSPAERASLSADDAELAQTAALLKAASPERSAPDEAFIERLRARLASGGAEREAAPPVAPGGADNAATPLPHRKGLSRRGLLGRVAAATAGLAVGA